MKNVVFKIVVHPYLLFMYFTGSFSLFVLVVSFTVYIIKENRLAYITTYLHLIWVFDEHSVKGCLYVLLLYILNLDKRCLKINIKNQEGYRMVPNSSQVVDLNSIKKNQSNPFKGFSLK